MPYLKIETNHDFTDERKDQLLTKLSKFLSLHLVKPEKYVMCVFDDKPRMIFNSTFDPAVFIEIKSMGLKESQTAELTKSLCEFINKEIGIKSNRVYIEFSSLSGKMWGHDGTTF